MTLFPDDGAFPEARQAWIPKLVDILVRRTNAPTETEQAYYSKFGLDMCDWGSYTKLNAAKDAIVQYWEERYLDRMINSETLEMWQNRLQRKFDEIAPKYERAMSLYTSDTIDAFLQSMVVTYNNVKDEHSGEDTVTVTDTDTPDTAINAAHTYADSVRTSVDSGNRANTRTGSVTTDYTPNGGTVDAINKSIDGFRVLTVDFCAEFENLFLNVFWY